MSIERHEPGLSRTRTAVASDGVWTADGGCGETPGSAAAHALTNPP
jgi:hypothetical protein